MSPKTTPLNDATYDYLVSWGTREEALLSELRRETHAHPLARMQVSPEQGQFLRFLVAALGVKNAIEVGVFTGYSALCTALALPKGGRLLACDVEPSTTAIALRYFERAGLTETLDLRIAPAVETLESVLKQAGAGSFDFAFIDADKENYGRYYELCLQLLRVGGVIAVDNVLWGGSVTDPSNTEPSTVAIRAFNEQVQKDARVDLCMLPLADGLTLLRKL